jgi:cholesterol transport system auxiliary component
LAALVLPGCAVLPGGGPPPLDTYDLTLSTEESNGPRRSRLQILIPEPAALKALDGENIVVAPRPGAVQFLKGAQWSDRLPRIVQARLVEAFQASGSLGGVGMPGEGLAIDYQVVTEIRAFEIRIDGDARAHVELYVKLLNDRNGVVRASRSVSATAPVNGADNDDYVAALDLAFTQASAEIVSWTLGRL